MRFEVYQDRAGKWRWRLVAANGKRVAASGESFASASNAARATNDLVAGIFEAFPINREATQEVR